MSEHIGLLDREWTLAEFDRQVGIAPRVQISDIDIPFWGMVSLIIKFYFALLAASALVSVLFGVGFLIFMLLTNR